MCEPIERPKDVAEPGDYRRIQACHTTRMMSNHCHHLRRHRQICVTATFLAVTLICCLIDSTAAFLSSPWLGFTTQKTPRSGNQLKHQKYGREPSLKVAYETLGDQGVNGLYSEDGTSSGVLTPYQVLHPAAFSPESSGIDRKLPLYACLNLLRNALERISKGQVDMAYLLDPVQRQDPFLVRLEHVVSHSVDPLCWLHSQTRGGRCMTSDPLLYFCNAEKSLETGVYGSACTHCGASNETLWDLISKLPDKSRVYGGERFDQGSTVGEEWKAFGSGMWILPAVELRIESQGGNKSSATTVDVDGAHDTHFVQTSGVPTTTISVHLVRGEGQTWQETANLMLERLNRLSDSCSDAVPTTTLPPVISRDSSYGPDMDGQDIYERGVTKALEIFENIDDDRETMRKVVLARRMDLHFGPYAELCGLDIVRRWKYGGHEGGHLIYLFPGISSGVDSSCQREFFGCTPERLFQIQDGVVRSESLAGTRPRGSTQEADAELMRDLFTSRKDREENLITGRYIRKNFLRLHNEGLLEDHESITGSDQERTGFFVRRLRHLQHICQRLEGEVTWGTPVVDVTRQLLQGLHPTPAVCGYPLHTATDFIRNYETIGFDRGFYSGPFGCLGRESADIVVAIRSGLLSKASQVDGEASTKVSVFGGAGIVPGSNVQTEWAETSYKLDVISSLFLSSPITLKSAPTPNVAWTTAFIEEMVRCGVTQFYVCPGSRSTPLVAAVAKAVRSNVGVVQALSVHDERAAGFRALGYGRATNRPAAVITSSGTAVGNLYPSVMEAGMDGIPLLLLTADRPYENRDTGANQALDQVKVFSSTYVRWFRDIPPPSDDVPVSLVLSDADQAVNLSRKLMGPVHLNIQFRENLAPEGGPIRNDNRVDSLTAFNGFRFTDSPGFRRWSMGGGRWLRSFSSSQGSGYYPNSVMGGDNSIADSAQELARLIAKSKRGIIVTGNIRATGEKESQTADTISNFAQMIGFPILAGIQSGSLRRRSSAVVPFAEHLLKHPSVSQKLNPDLVLQIGAPLVSTEIQNMLLGTMKFREQLGDVSASAFSHVLLHPHYPHERADPNFTATHQISAEIGPFLKSVLEQLTLMGVTGKDSRCSSELCPLVSLGHALRDKMPDIINDASRAVVVEELENGVSCEDVASGSSGSKEPTLTEPQVVLALSEVLSELDSSTSLFLSNSMPVRNAEFFLYPLAGPEPGATNEGKIGVNRGASGIDGIISTASGFAEATELPTTLLIGDLAALHDVNAFHTLSNGKTSSQISSRRTPSLTTVVVNNDGGGIFSFLPISKWGSEVSFDEFFGTPTSSFSFQRGVEAFGIPCTQGSDYKSFSSAYREALQSDQPVVVEAQVVGRDANVAVLGEISRRVVEFLDTQLSDTAPDHILHHPRLPLKSYGRDMIENLSYKDSMGEVDENPEKVLLMLHGWMGDKTEWDKVGTSLVDSIPSDWTIISLDLPGHGDGPLYRSSAHQMVLSMLDLLPGQSKKAKDEHDLSIDEMALSILRSLVEDHNVKKIDAVAGYSLGGRVALAMRRLSLWCDEVPSLLSEETKMILLGSYPGALEELSSDYDEARSVRMAKDDALSQSIIAGCNKACLFPSSLAESSSIWSDFLEKWYGISSLWGNIEKDQPSRFREMIAKRVETLNRRGRDIAAVLHQSSPSRHASTDWDMVNPTNTLFIAGSLDVKYSGIGRLWSHGAGGVNYIEIPDAGHALLVETPIQVADSIFDFLTNKERFNTDLKPFSGADGLAASDGSKEKEAFDPHFAADQQLSDTAPASSDLEVAEKMDTTQVDAEIAFGDVGSLDFESFQIDLVTGRQEGVFGIGWGEKAQFSEENRVNRRCGFILNLVSVDGTAVGIGETSPLSGLHRETLDDAKSLLKRIKRGLEELEPDKIPKFDAQSLLAMDGALKEYIGLLMDAIGVDGLTPSVSSGIEMCLLSLASQAVRTPLLQAISENALQKESSVMMPNTLPLNCLVMRGRPVASSVQQSKKTAAPREYAYESLKVKVGHQSAEDDALAISRALQETERHSENPGRIRADANRAWSMDDAEPFTASLDILHVDATAQIEFVEEPLRKISSKDDWSFVLQLRELEEWHRRTRIPYALDETLADLAEQKGGEFDLMAAEIRNAFSGGKAPIRGCAAFVVKPALLGLELSLQLARLAHSVLGIGAVFSSSFDSGVGLAYTAFLGAAADAASSPDSVQYAHGAGTFSMLGEDTLSPPFASYVDERGTLNVASLSRALYGLGLDEMRESFVPGLPEDELSLPEQRSQDIDEYQSSAETSSSGREISVVVSLPLPFSDDVASSRFADLPQMSRWSPWLNSVAYLDGQETEWTLNVRGVVFSWRAVSTILEQPYRGITWESVSGLKNMGMVEFIPTSEESCIMKLKMTIVTPRILAALFRGTSVFIEDFVQNKILKWSLEMFRDVVKGDLALERGDVELGDALFGAVEGRANAIEATLSYPGEKEIPTEDQ